MGNVPSLCLRQKPKSLDQSEDAQYRQTKLPYFDRQYPAQSGHWWPNIPVLSDAMKTGRQPRIGDSFQ